MKKAKSRAQRRRAVRNVLLAVSMMMMLMIVTVGGTVAWLTAETTQVVNTFTATDIEITLTETPNDGEAWTAQIIPGKEYPKDPVVTVDRDKTTVDIWLYVEFDPSTSATYLDYDSNLSVDDGWKKLTTAQNVWYREVLTTEQGPEGTADPTYHLLEGDKVTVKTSVVKADPEDGQVVMPSEGFTMTYQAYAIQKEGSVTAEDGWAKLFPTNP